MSWMGSDNQENNHGDESHGHVYGYSQCVTGDAIDMIYTLNNEETLTTLHTALQYL